MSTAPHTAAGGRVGKKRPLGLGLPEEAPRREAHRVGGRAKEKFQVFGEHLKLFFKHLYFVACAHVVEVF